LGTDVADWTGMSLPHCMTKARDRKSKREVLCIDFLHTTIGSDIFRRCM